MGQEPEPGMTGQVLDMMEPVLDMTGLAPVLDMMGQVVERDTCHHLQDTLDSH
jgi:hypothetical protein